MNRTSDVPRGSTFAIRLNHDLNGAAVPEAVSRSCQNLTSSASKRLPSCHRTPRRSVKVQVVGLVFAHDSARHGTIFRPSSYIARLWYVRSPHTWTDPIQIPTPGLHTNVFAWIAAGDAGRADIAWYGTDCDQTTCGDPNNPNEGPDSTLGHWSLYLTQTLDGLDAVPAFTAPILASEHFIHFGSMFTLIGGQSGDRALGDFLQLRIGPQGEALISYADSNNVAGDAAPHAMFVRQVGGSSVLANHPAVSIPQSTATTVADPMGDGRYEADSQVSSNIPNLDILRFRLWQRTPTTYRIKMKVADLTSLAPPGPPDSDTDLVWLVQWLVPSSTDPDGGRFFFAYMESTAGGAPQFFDGVAQSTSDFYVTYPGVNQITGTVIPGAPGVIRMDVPIADVTVPGAIGPTLYSVTASTMTLPQPANSSPATNGVLFNLIDVTRAYDLTP